MSTDRKRKRTTEEASIRDLLLDLSARLENLEKREKRRRLSDENAESEAENHTEEDASDTEQGDGQGTPSDGEGETNGELDPAIKALLGQAAPLPTIYGVDILNEIVQVWTPILTGGLDTSILTELQSKYPVPGNCTLITAPKLNKEVEMAIEGHSRTREGRLVEQQTKLGSALAALGKALTALISDGKGPEHKQVIEMVSDAARILCGAQHAESTSRRNLLLLDVNTELRTTLQQAPIGEWLFGEAVVERVKTAQALEVSSSILKKEKTPKKPSGSKALNSKGLPRRQPQSKGPGRQYTRSNSQRTPARSSYKGQARAPPKKASQARFSNQNRH